MHKMHDLHEFVHGTLHLKNEGFCNVRLLLKFSSAPLKPTPEKLSFAEVRFSGEREFSAR